MTTRNNPTNATDMKIRENEIIQRRGKQIMKRLPFEINQIILMYLEDGRGINIKALQSWRIFIASSAIRPNNNFEGFSGINEMMYNPFNEAINRRFRAYEIEDAPNRFYDNCIEIERVAYKEISDSLNLHETFSEMTDREIRIRDVMMSSDFFPHIGRYEYIRIQILDVTATNYNAYMLIAQTPTNEMETNPYTTGLYEIEQLKEYDAIIEYGTTVSQIHHCYKYPPDDNDRIMHKDRWISEFDPEILNEIFLRFPQNMRKEMQSHYVRDCQHFPRMTDLEHGHFANKLFSGGRDALTVEEIRYFQGSDLGRCLLRGLILLDIDNNGRKTTMWNLDTFQKWGDDYHARGNFKIFVIELLRIWGMEKMTNEAYRWGKMIDVANGDLNPIIRRLCSFDGTVYKLERFRGLDELDNEEHYYDDGIIHDVNPEEIDGDALDGDGGDY